MLGCDLATSQANGKKNEFPYYQGFTGKGRRVLHQDGLPAVSLSSDFGSMLLGTVSSAEGQMLAGMVTHRTAVS